MAAVSSLMNLVLQMPRGNLETIYPRAFAMDVIHADIARYECVIYKYSRHTAGHSLLVGNIE